MPRAKTVSKSDEPKNNLLKFEELTWSIPARASANIYFSGVDSFKGMITLRMWPGFVNRDTVNVTFGIDDDVNLDKIEEFDATFSGLPDDIDREINGFFYVPTDETIKLKLVFTFSDPTLSVFPYEFEVKKGTTNFVIPIKIKGGAER